MEKSTIHSLKELQLLMPRIIQEYGSNQQLTTLALANHILALEEAGFTVTASAKKEIEQHTRFGKKNAERYDQLEKEVEKETGTTDLNDPDKLAIALSSLLPKERIDKKSLIGLLKTRPRIKNEKFVDNLEEIKGAHPVIDSLLALRKLESEHPAFADPAQIRDVKKMLEKSPLRNVVFKLKDQ